LGNEAFQVSALTVGAAGIFVINLGKGPKENIDLRLAVVTIIFIDRH
jgi:hypothetical protein